MRETRGETEFRGRPWSTLKFIDKNDLAHIVILIESCCTSGPLIKCPLFVGAICSILCSCGVNAECYNVLVLNLNHQMLFKSFPQTSDQIKCITFRVLKKSMILTLK